MPALWPADGTPFNQGDDIAGYVERVGDDVVGFAKGDRVAAFHQVMTPHGSFAEYALAWDYTTFHIPSKTSFEEAATIPLCAITAALGLYQTMKLPLPWNPTSDPIPLVVYGGATAVGAFAIKFAQVSNIHPIITVAGRGIPYVKTLLSPEKGDVVIDYRGGNESVRAQIKAAAGGRPIHYAYDGVSENGSLQNIAPALTGPGEIAVMFPDDEFQPPEGMGIGQPIAGSVHYPPAAGKTIEYGEFGAAFFQLIGRGLRQGWFQGHPFEVRPGGLAGLEGALRDLKEGRASAVK
ncbi:chaperonin 10-like protein [Aspergillus aurantiobrunneus]